MGELWLSEHKDIVGLLVLTRLGADNIPDATFKQGGLWLYLTICMRGAANEDRTGQQKVEPAKSQRKAVLESKH